jgi:hypothetical protein
MKKTVSTVLASLLLLAMAFCLASCGDSGDPWESVTYLADTELGEGAKTVEVKVTANDRSVVFTIHTDEEILGAALLAHGLIAGEPAAFGLYVKVVNGMTADYDTTKTYWSFYQDGEYMMAGVDSTAIAGGERFEIVLAK